MSLDQNLFTLSLTPNTSHPAGTVVDLIDNSGTIHYRKRRIVSEQQVYRVEVSDPLSEALLASATAPSATSKHKTLELYNPSKVVELKYTGTLTFRWSFKWETHEFEWKREECFIIRKPDPPVLVAVTKEPPGRIRTASVQILDYNLNRFDIEDRKGLEIVVLTALLTFQDASDVYHEPTTTTAATPSTPSSTPDARTTSASSSSSSAAPPPPPKPAPKKGIERIVELQAGRGHVNEVTVLEEGAVADYAKYCVRLLQDEAMLFISVCSSDPDQVPKVLHVVEEIKRLRYKAGDPDLHQYVLYDTKEGAAPQKAPRIINLDDDNGRGKSKEYSPPKSLTVHLGKIDMPELRPRGMPLDKRQTTRQDPDGGKKKVHVKTRDKNGGDSGRVKQQPSSPPPPRHGTSEAPRAHPPSVMYAPRSRYVHPRPAALSPTGPGPSYRAPPPPLPPRAPPPHVQQGPAGALRRPSTYGPVNAVQDRRYYDEYYYGVQHEATGRDDHATATTTTATSGLLGRLLGR